MAAKAKGTGSKVEPAPARSKQKPLSERLSALDARHTKARAALLKAHTVRRLALIEAQRVEREALLNGRGK